MFHLGINTHIELTSAFVEQVDPVDINVTEVVLIADISDLIGRVPWPDGDRFTVIGEGCQRVVHERHEVIASAKGLHLVVAVLAEVGGESWIG